MSIGYGVYAAISKPVGDFQRSDQRQLRMLITHIIVWLPASIMGFLPVLFDAYVPVNDGTLCWFSPAWPMLRLINLIPLCIYMALSLTLLCYTYSMLRSLEVAAASRRTIVCRLVSVLCSIFSVFHCCSFCCVALVHWCVHCGVLHVNGMRVVISFVCSLHCSLFGSLLLG